MSGIIDLSETDYHADASGNQPSLSSSYIKILCEQSPLHCWAAHPRLNPDWQPEESKVMDLGKIAHALLLEGINKAHIIQAHKFEGAGKNRADTGELVTDYKTLAAREEREWCYVNRKIPLLAHQWPEVEAMVSACRRQLSQHKQASDMFTNGKPEQTLEWTEDGIRCKARVDWLHNDFSFIDDLKTTGITAKPQAISLSKSGMDIQAAWYLRGLKILHPECNPVFRFCFVETYQPNAISVITPCAGSLLIGEKKCLYGMEKWKECLASGVWPGYSRNVWVSELKTWEEEDWLKTESGEI